jgi:hypothetical protein
VTKTDAETKAFYYSGSTPGLSLTETDATGLYTALNVPPGRITIKATLKATGQRIGEVSIAVASGAISTVSAAPTP